jgi:hypothetical protein
MTAKEDAPFAAWARLGPQSLLRLGGMTSGLVMTDTIERKLAEHDHIGWPMS